MREMPIPVAGAALAHVRHPRFAMGAALALVALFAVLAKAPPALADTNQPHPPIADCRQAWDDSSAENSCHTENISTAPGNCVISAQCKRTGVFSAGDPVPDNCVRLRIAQSVVGPSEYEQWCESSVTFPPATTTDVANCDGKLKTSNC